jgi:peroxiredoxin
MRGRPSIAAGLVLTALAVFTVWITWQAKKLESRLRGPNPSAALRGQAAPGFELTALDGRSVSLANYRGKNVVVSFWASWCAPCRREMPSLRSFYQRTHNAGSDYEVLAISLDETRAAAQNAATEWKIPFPVLLDSTGHVAGHYRVKGIPTLVVIDKLGKVQYAKTGFDIGTEFALAQQLGIKNYAPAPGAQN